LPLGPARLTLAAVAMAAAGCARDGLGAHPPGPMSSTILALAADLGAAPADVADSWVRVNEIAAQVRERHRRGGGGDWIADMNAVVFDQLGFEREIASQDVRFFRLPSVVAERHASCLGLGALYLVVAERLGVGLDGVMVPGHFFVRTRELAHRNIELLRRGESMPDAWYRTKYGPWPEGGESPYFRPLDPSEVAGVHWFNAGNHLRAAHDLAGAAVAYDRAAAALPGFAEAEASLGAARQLQGALDQAEAAYRQAAHARPDLPGLDHNLALLKRERVTRSDRRPSP
ncbi:MAG TPA: transglutaminase family protein, partial [Polyangia bacterium]|nr:transglutaminase family protein [Polyangia bacterium]